MTQKNQDKLKKKFFYFRNQPQKENKIDIFLNKKKNMS
jgi:hypothetical protein